MIIINALATLVNLKVSSEYSSIQARCKMDLIAEISTELEVNLAEKMRKTQVTEVASIFSGYKAKQFMNLRGNAHEITISDFGETFIERRKNAINSPAAFEAFVETGINVKTLYNSLGFLSQSQFNQWLKENPKVSAAFTAGYKAAAETFAVKAVEIYQPLYEDLAGLAYLRDTITAEADIDADKCDGKIFRDKIALDGATKVFEAHLKLAMNAQSALETLAARRDAKYSKAGDGSFGSPQNVSIALHLGGGNNAQDQSAKIVNASPTPTNATVDAIESPSFSISLGGKR